MRDEASGQFDSVHEVAEQWAANSDKKGKVLLNGEEETAGNKTPADTGPVLEHKHAGAGGPCARADAGGSWA